MPLGEIPPQAVRTQLDKILSSDLFERSERLSRFLRFTVEQALARNRSGLKEYAVAREVFDKPEEFDTRLDPIVRVEARRLRSKLRDYYEEEGKTDPVLIHFGRRGYAPKFEMQAPSPEAGDTVRPNRRRRASRSNGKQSSGNGKVEQAPESSVAVLPFIDMSRDGDLEHFCDGLTEELINALTRVANLQVVSRSSAFQFKGPAQDVREVGEQLGVSAVLEGSVRKVRNKLRVTAQLASVNDGFHLWSETYNTELSDEFTVQEEIAAKIAETLKSHRGESLTPELTHKQTSSPEAFRQYLKGLYHRNSAIPSDLAQGVACFEAAIEEDAEYAQAYAGLANCWGLIAWLGVDRPEEAWTKAKAAALKALELDETIASAHAALGASHCVGDWNWPEAENAFAQANAVDADDFMSLQWQATVFLAPRKKFDEALALGHKAVERSPQSLYAHGHIGLVHFYRGEIQEAMRYHREVLRIKSDFVPALWDLGRAYLADSKFTKAETAFNKALKASGGHPLVLGSLGGCYAQMGKKKEARSVARDLIKLSDEVYVPPLAVVCVYAALGDVDRSFEWLDKAVEDRSSRLIEIDVNPMYEPLREDSRLENVRKAICMDEES